MEIFNQLLFYIKELCENELVRAVDPDLIKRRQNQRRREESYTVFLKDYDQSVTKPKVYQIMSTYGVTSKVMASSINRYKYRIEASCSNKNLTFFQPCYLPFNFRTAHILVNSRKSAVSIENEFKNNQSEKQFGPNCKIHLIKEQKLSEYEDGADGRPFLYNPSKIHEDFLYQELVQ